MCEHIEEAGNTAMGARRDLETAYKRTQQGYVLYSARQAPPPW